MEHRHTHSKVITFMAVVVGRHHTSLQADSVNVKECRVRNTPVQL